MPEFEKKLIRLINKYFEYLLAVAALAGGILIRIMLMSAYALPEKGGGNALHIIGDIFLTVSVMVFIRKTAADKTGSMALRVLLFILPSVSLASAMYGRLENISFAFCILALYQLEKKEHFKGMLLYAFACLFSIYAWLLIPFIIMTAGRDKAFSKLFYLMPLIPSIVHAFLNDSYIPAGYINKHLYENCGSFFSFLNGNGEKSFGRYLPICLVLTAFMLYLIIRYFDRLFMTTTVTERLGTALIITEVFASFLPGADMGSTAFGSMLAWCVAFTDAGFLPAAVVFGYLRLLPMTGALYGQERMTFSYQGQTWIRVALIIALCVRSYLKRDKKHVL
ncbi:MAG: hypothetical protein K5686_02870 [Lachnospiraceae bacterium]|nr:hypothetical protein [Lachnospiraceae bacterium]